MSRPPLPSTCLVGDLQHLDIAGNEPTDGLMPTDSAPTIDLEADTVKAMLSLETGIAWCLTVLVVAAAAQLFSAAMA